MKTKRLTRARKEAQGPKPATRSAYERKMADRRASDLRIPTQVLAHLDEG